MKKARTNSSFLAEFVFVLAMGVLGVMVVAVQDKPAAQLNPVQVVAAGNTVQPQPVAVQAPPAVTPPATQPDVVHDVLGVEEAEMPQPHVPARVAVVDAASATPTPAYQPPAPQQPAPVPPAQPPVEPAAEIVVPPAEETGEPPADEEVVPPVDGGYGNEVTIAAGEVSQSITLNAANFLPAATETYWLPGDPVAWSDDILPEILLAPVYMVAEYDPLAEPTGHYGPTMTFHVRAQAFAEAGQNYEVHLQLTDPVSGDTVAITIPVYIVAEA